MTTFPRPRSLAIAFLALSLAWTVSPDTASAGKPNFAIKTHVRLDESGQIWLGTWTMDGVADDSGMAAVSRGYQGLDTLWLESEAGSMTIGLIKFDPLTEERIDRFVVDEGSGAYESWVGATGTFQARYGRSNGGHSLKGFLP